ncbi:MAG: proline dehydrogenase family protein [Clostridia bacterium]|nr:proline dehydrogenase family protein [Deltaproteobacteria bacterium]
MNPLIRAIPAPLVRLFARPYVAGDSLNDALNAAATLWAKNRLMTTLDLLAENITTETDAKRNRDVYLSMVDAVANDPRFTDPASRPTLSLKQSSYTTRPLEQGGDARGCREAVFSIAERAKEAGVRLTIDMESSHWTDFTFETLRLLHEAGHTHVGAVVQTRLLRTEHDLDSLPPDTRVRLVIGIYQERAAVALTDKTLMKERLLVQAERLLARGHYVELGTHDETYVRRFLDEVVPRVCAPADRYEVQMLYGVPRHRLQHELVQRGVQVRVYVPFAIGWSKAIAYLRRRLDEYPQMMFLVAKNLFSRG